MKRLENGLLEGIEYKKDEFGFIDWRALIPTKYLFPNNEKLAALGKEAADSIDGLDDSMILIKLAGIKWLAKVRGFTGVYFKTESITPYPVVRCEISWIPNEEHPTGATYEEIASCNAENADELSLKFRESIAANRAFVRCVRNFLNVNIVGEEEVFNKAISSPSESPESPEKFAVTPQDILLNNAKKKGFTLASLIELANKEGAAIPLECSSEKDFCTLLEPKIARKLLKAIKKV